MSNSTGLALQAGVNYALSKDFGLFASIAKINVKSKVVATGATVLTTTVDFRPTRLFGRRLLPVLSRAGARRGSRENASCLT